MIFFGPVQAALGQLAAAVGPTQFTGYTALAGSGKVVALLEGGRQVERVAAGAFHCAATVV